MRADLVARGAREAGSALQHFFTSKMAKYDDREGIVFLPLAADTFGLFKRLGQLVAGGQGGGGVSQAED